MKISLATSKV